MSPLYFVKLYTTGKMLLGTSVKPPLPSPKRQAIDKNNGGVLLMRRHLSGSCQPERPTFRSGAGDKLLAE